MMMSHDHKWKNNLEVKVKALIKSRKKTWQNQNAINDINALIIIQHFGTHYIFWTHTTYIRFYVNEINML